MYSNSNENMLFWKKTDKTILKLPPPPPRPHFKLTAPLPPTSEQFFNYPFFVQILKTRKNRP